MSYGTTAKGLLGNGTHWEVRPAGSDRRNNVAQRSTWSAPDESNPAAAGSEKGFKDQNTRLPAFRCSVVFGDHVTFFLKEFGSVLSAR